MRPGEQEPNYHYRPWLEHVVGEQHVDWQWDLHPGIVDNLCIWFVKEEHAVLFELSWS
jgi:hypothetical protein